MPRLLFRIEQIFFADGFEIIQIFLPALPDLLFTHAGNDLLAQLVVAGQLVEEVRVGEKVLFVSVLPVSRHQILQIE